MIDIEKQVFTIVSTAIRQEYPDAFVTGEYVKSPPSFPCVSLIEMDNIPFRRTQTSACMENHAELMYEVNIYSNKTAGKKTECRTLAQLIDAQMANMGFTRMLLNPVPNLEDATVYRIVGRYKAIVDKNNTIYRR